MIGGAALMLVCAAALMADVAIEGCAGTTPQQVVNGETTALDLTQAACSVADTTGDAYVVFGCALADLGLQTAVKVTQMFVSVPASGAAAFAAAHPETETSKPLVVAYRQIHPTAAAGTLTR
jgi:hypothetical protein